MVCTGCRSQTIPMPVAQSVYHWHMDTLSVLRHMPEGGECPLCEAQGVTAPNTLAYTACGTAPTLPSSSAASSGSGDAY